MYEKFRARFPGQTSLNMDDFMNFMTEDVGLKAGRASSGKGGGGGHEVGSSVHSVTHLLSQADRQAGRQAGR